MSTFPKERLVGDTLNNWVTVTVVETVTAADADLVVSATLLAVTV